MNTTEQQFLNDFDKKMWNSADRLRSSLDAALVLRQAEALADQWSS